LVFVAIRSGDFYMFDYESDEEEDEGKQDEATVAQEQVDRKIQRLMNLHILF
jgi:hypothetical protein